MVANITMLVLTLTSYKKYIRYAIFQLAIVLISVISIIMIDISLILSQIAILIAILNLAISLILCYKDVKEAIIRNIHM